MRRASVVVADLYSFKNARSTLVRPMSTVRPGDDDYQYLHRSVIPTMHFQPSLMRLPVPKLEDTCERYLRCQSVILTNEEMDKTKRLTDKFLASEGRKLHSILVDVDKANKHTSYISPMWFDMYLRDRRPIPLTHTPFIGYVDEPRQEYRGQAVRAANFLISSMRFLKTFKDGYLAPDIFHLNPKKSDTHLFRFETLNCSLECMRTNNLLWRKKIILAK